MAYSEIKQKVQNIVTAYTQPEENINRTLQAARLNICRSACRDRIIINPITNNEHCPVCKCPLLRKTSVLNEQCPERKW